MLRPEQKFLFDLNGFLVLKSALSASEVKSLNDAIDAHAGRAVPREGVLRNTAGESSFRAPATRRDLGGLLTLPGEAGTAFRSLLAHPKLKPALVELCGSGYRLDHQPLVLLQDPNSEGFSLHGGPLSHHDGVGSAPFNPELQYRSQGGAIWNSLLAMQVILSPVPAGAGGFCAIRGSHKLNFPVPADWMRSVGGTPLAEHVATFEAEPGDVIFFSEATVHGAMPWRADHERRVALYRFAPANFSYGRGYLNEWAAAAEVATAEEAAVLQPPYAPRLDRPIVSPTDTTVTTQHRAKEKVEHDTKVF
eukprot:CAMPEP_0170749620 /NCGR_PEP_ID=MMETSP0437-20130122/10490_1 /TAXON_ID=0 /ORGANISM="Sexangularia sp." /LENGTH=305 /DNA_ID=CAMNT_0011088551 /DNA_START=65 /DNA_END=979 /DNA_ORIENTATION=-